MSDGQAVLGADAGGLPVPAVDGSPAHSATERTDSKAQLYAAPKSHSAARLFMLAVGVVLYLGWQSRAEQHITAESGLGYQLGIIGSVMMLMLLIYPLRKRKRSLRWLGATKHWFRLHMILGILGPALILFHANFNLGSLNSRVALISMLLVVGSGLIGRYIYSKIHYSLYGRRMTLVELREITEDGRRRLAAILPFAPELQDRLRRYERSVITPPRSVLHSVVRIFLFGIRTWFARGATRRIVKRGLKQQAAETGWTRDDVQQHAKEAREYLSIYFATAHQIVGLGFYERMFALWHVLHVPLFILLVATAVMHVLAVHMY